GEEFLISMPPPKPNVGPGRKIPQVNHGHGLTYRNLRPLLMALLPCTVLHELNIGHSIVSRSIMVGMTAAVREMKELISLASRDALLLWQTGQVPEPYAPYTPRRGPALGDNVV
ncbi:MAG: pyridoxine 5'-phosphate synthase, partial [Planctomycetota bacterium]